MWPLATPSVCRRWLKVTSRRGAPSAAVRAPPSLPWYPSPECTPTRLTVSQGSLGKDAAEKVKDGDAAQGSGSDLMAQLSRSGTGGNAMEDPPAPGDSQRSSEEFESLFSTQAALACYKQRSEEFKKLFKELPEAERLVMDFACALQRDILLQGRLYLSEHWLCFHSNVFWGTTLMVALKNITAMTREKTARIIPNAIQICTEAEKLFFTSFSGREKSFQGIFRLWQKSVADKPLTESELWLMVRHHYGNELELELSLDDMMMMMTDGVQVAEGGARASTSTRAGGEDRTGRPAERPSSLRLAQADGAPGNGSSPVRDETRSTPAAPCGNFLNAEDSRSQPSRHRTPDASLDRMTPERVSKRSEPSVDRTVQEKVPKASEASLDRSASERGSKRYEAFLDRSAAVRGSKRLEASVDQTVPEKGSSRSEPSLDRTAPERGSKRSNASLDHSAAERGSKQSEMCLEPSAQEQLGKRSDFPLDLNDNGDVLDYSSSECAAEEERLCPSQVQGRVFVNRVFHMSADKMFELLFTDSPFNRRFMGARKVTGCTATLWQKDTSDSVKRTLTYTVTITNPLVGKSSRATEIQVLYKKKHEEQHYMVETEVYMHDVPYHDYFYTLNRYCIIYNSKRKCRLRIHTDVKYKKQPWGLAKSFITKNSWSGLEEYFRHLEAELLDEEAELTQGPGDLSKAGGLRRRRRAYSRSLPEHLKPGKQYSGDAGQRRESLAGGLDTTGPKRWNLSTIVAAMSFLLLLLTLLNLGLFFKLWAMEDVAQQMYLSTKQRLQERPHSSLNPDLGSRPLPPNRSKEDIQLLRTVLEESIQLLEQLRSSLVVLQHIFQVRNDTSPHR